MITADTLDNREPAEADLLAARQGLAAALEEAFRPEREANIARRAAKQTAPTFLRLNRHERRRLAALARKH